MYIICTTVIKRKLLPFFSCTQHALVFSFAINLNWHSVLVDLITLSLIRQRIVRVSGRKQYGRSDDLSKGNETATFNTLVYCMDR